MLKLVLYRTQLVLGCGNGPSINILIGQRFLWFRVCFCVWGRFFAVKAGNKSIYESIYSSEDYLFESCLFWFVKGLLFPVTNLSCLYRYKNNPFLTPQVLLSLIYCFRGFKPDILKVILTVKFEFFVVYQRKTQRKQGSVRTLILILKYFSLFFWFFPFFFFFSLCC